MNVSRRRVPFALTGIADILVAIRFLGNRKQRCSVSRCGHPERSRPAVPERDEPTATHNRGWPSLNPRQPERASRGCFAALRHGLRTQGAGREDGREFHAFRVALEESTERKTGSAGQESGQRLIEHLLCFHRKLLERKFCSKEKFFHLFLIDFPLQAKERCVSLKTSKRRGTFQGITERGT